MFEEKTANIEFTFGGSFVERSETPEIGDIYVGTVLNEQFSNLQWKEVMSVLICHLAITIQIESHCQMRIKKCKITSPKTHSCTCTKYIYTLPLFQPIILVLLKQAVKRF